MNARLMMASALMQTHCIYDNRPSNWLDRWPQVTKVEYISAGRMAIQTTGRLFVMLPTTLVLVRADTLTEDVR